MLIYQAGILDHNQSNSMLAHILSAKRQIFKIFSEHLAEKFKLTNSRTNSLIIPMIRQIQFNCGPNILLIKFSPQIIIYNIRFAILICPHWFKSLRSIYDYN